VLLEQVTDDVGLSGKEVVEAEVLLQRSEGIVRHWIARQRWWVVSIYTL
jgi:hypothetical protein